MSKKAKIIQKGTKSEPNQMVDMSNPPQQQLDLSKRSLQEQIVLLKGGYYAAHANAQSEFDQLINSLTNMILAKENRILQLTQENKDLMEKLNKSTPATGSKSNKQ